MLCCEPFQRNPNYVWFRSVWIHVFGCDSSRACPAKEIYMLALHIAALWVIEIWNPGSKADYENSTPLTAGTWKSTQLKGKMHLNQTFDFPGCSRFSNHHLKDDESFRHPKKKNNVFLFPPNVFKPISSCPSFLRPFPISGSSTHPLPPGPTWKLVELMATSNSWILPGIELGKVLEGIFLAGKKYHKILRKVSTHLKYIRQLTTWSARHEAPVSKTLILK